MGVGDLLDASFSGRPSLLLLLRPFLLLLSSSSTAAEWALRRLPWPLRFLCAASSVSGAFSLLPIVSWPATGPGLTINSLLSAPLRARPLDASNAGMTLLMICRACFARMSLRIAGGARPLEVSVRPMAAKSCCLKNQTGEHEASRCEKGWRKIAMARMRIIRWCTASTVLEHGTGTVNRDC